MSLFANTADFALHYPALESVDFTRIKPSIDLVERQYLRDQLLGSTLYDALHTAYQASITGSPLVAVTSAQAALLALLKPAVAHMAAAEALPTLNVAFTDTGAMVQSTANLAPAPMWRTRDAQAAAMKMGLSYLDQAIDLLLLSGNTYSWQDTAFAVRVKACLVQTVAQFEEYVPIGGSGWLLHRLRPAMLDVQKYIRNVLCDTAYTALVAQVQAGTMSAPYSTILPYTRKAVALLAMAQQVPLMALQLDHQGIWTFKAANSGQNSGGPLPATDRRVEHLQEQYAKRAQEALKELETEARRLAAAGTFPDYADSACYAVAATRGSTNTEGSSSFSMM